MKKIRVLNVINSMGAGGAQKVVLNYLENFCDDDSIELILLVFNGKTDYYYDNYIKEKKLKVVYLNCPKCKIRIPFISKIADWIIGQKAIYNAIVEINPDIVHVHIARFLFYSLYPIVKAKIPVKMVTFHSNPLRDTKQYYRSIKSAINKYGFIPIFLNKQQMQIANDYYKFAGGEIAYNGINISSISSNKLSKSDACSVFSLDENSFIISAVGRLNPIKNYSFLIEIFGEIIKKRKESVLVIAGDGEEMANLKNKVDNLGLNGKVIFLGSIDNVLDLYYASDVFVMTSISEASPLVLIEAQAAGTRCVISNGVPSESIVTDRVKKMNVDSTITEWADAILDENYKGIKVENMEKYSISSSMFEIKELYLKYYKLKDQSRR